MLLFWWFNLIRRFWSWLYFDRWKVTQKYLIYDISYKALISSKPFRIRWHEIDRLIIIYDGTRYSKLIGTEKYEATFDRIRYLLSLKCGIAYVFSLYFAKIKNDSYDFLPIKKKYWFCIIL